MDLVQSRIVTDDVERLAAFYARLVRGSVVLNDYYVEVPAGAASVGFSRRRFTEYREDQAARPCSQPAGGHLGDGSYHSGVGVSHDDLQGPGREPGQRLLAC